MPTDAPFTDRDSVHVVGPTPERTRRLGALLWLPGLAVALGAAVATAHGLYEVAVASLVPAGIAWLYPLITDGLALVAYAATARLAGSAARYAWSVMIVAAGLSGLAQAAYLAGGPAVEVAPGLRFGVGAWPAIAAAVVAHLLYLLATDPAPAADTRPGVQPRPPFNGPGVQPYTVQSGPGRTDGAPVSGEAPAAQPTPDDDPSAGPSPSAETPRALPSPARDRAEAAAAEHARRHSAWPTVSEVETAAQVSRGTAAAALRALRERPLPLRLINPSDTEAVTDPGSEATP